MARARKNKPNKSGRNENSTGRFARLPHEVLLSAAYCSLTPNGRALLVELTAMENGQNNGSLWLSVRDAAARIGLVNKDSAAKAFGELEAAGLLRMTKEAHFSVKTAETSRARCWRLTFLPAIGTGRTDEWRQFEPVDKGAKRRMEMGLGAHKAYRKAMAKEKMPVLDSWTIRESAVHLEGRAVHKLRTAKPDNHENAPILVVHDSGPHTAVTMDTGPHALCWRVGRLLRVLPDILPAAWPAQPATSALAA
jgi:hypothetical protein